jgi:hypothetical protein
VKDVEGNTYYINIDLVQAVQQLPDPKRCHLWFGIDDKVTMKRPLTRLPS